MKIFRNLEDFVLPDKPLVAVLGNFDGVHLGHQKLIKTAKDITDSLRGETLVFTFFPHPQLVLNKEIQMLNSFELKTRLIKDLGVDSILAIPFTEEISKLTPQQFVQQVLHEKLKVSHVVAGFNFSFGYQGSGKALDLIRLAGELNIKVTIMEPFYMDKELVSSTRIREYIKKGQIKKASKLLGYQPTIQGKVVSGNRIGRQIGFPTANLEWDRHLLIPGPGVYAVKVAVNDDLKLGVLNIGFKPTVSEKEILTMEVNILEFNQEIYDWKIEINFYEKIRNEKKFNNITQLKEQIALDIDRKSVV